MSDLKLGANLDLDVLNIVNGGTAEDVGDNHGVGQDQGANPLGGLNQVLGGVMNLMKAAGPVLGLLGI